MGRRDIIVVGASAGGANALAQLLRGLPAGFPASMFIVCHFPSECRGVPERFARNSRWSPIVTAQPCHRGRTVPARAHTRCMPQTAATLADADFVIPVAQMAPLLVKLVREQPLTDRRAARTEASGTRQGK